MQIQEEGNFLFYKGTCFQEGEIVKRDYEKSFYYFNQAATYGNQKAYFKLGYFYANGYGVKQSKKKKPKYYFPL